MNRLSRPKKPGVLARIFKQALPQLRGKTPRVDDLFTPFPLVLEELERRREDTSLRVRVEAYLNNDLPEYFKNKPVLYLARHVATPNFETLRFVDLIERPGVKTVIGQDTKDRFIANNPLKRALGKLPISTGITKKDNRVFEQYRKVSILDFNSNNGKTFDAISTIWGEPLVEFHNGLFKKLGNRSIQIEDDALWIDRCHRGNLLAHYKKFLALFITHGVMFEDYQVQDKQEGKFVTEVLRPAFLHVEREFGLRPLITQLLPTSAESVDFWESYPREVLEIIEYKLKAKS